MKLYKILTPILIWPSIHAWWRIRSWYFPVKIATLIIASSIISIFCNELGQVIFQFLRHDFCFCKYRYWWTKSYMSFNPYLKCWWSIFETSTKRCHQHHCQSLLQHPLLTTSSSFQQWKNLHNQSFLRSCFYDILFFKNKYQRPIERPFFWILKFSTTEIKTRILSKNISAWLTCIYLLEYAAWIL